MARKEAEVSEMKAPGSWDERFRVRAGETGPGSLLRLPALCDWLQETAGNHAAALEWGTDALRERGIAWVLSRLTLEVTALPRQGEEALVRTWPSGVYRLWSLREFEVTDPQGAGLARATTGWLLFRLADRKPSRPPRELAALEASLPPRLIDDRFEEVAAPSSSAAGPVFRVGRYDLDANGHANNVAIVRWLLESLPSGPGLARPSLRTRIELRGECFEGDVLNAHVERAGAATLHSLVRESDAREVARAETTLPGDDR